MSDVNELPVAPQRRSSWMSWIAGLTLLAAISIALWFTLRDDAAAATDNTLIDADTTVTPIEVAPINPPTTPSRALGSRTVPHAEETRAASDPPKPKTKRSRKRAEPAPSAEPMRPSDTPAPAAPPPEPTKPQNPSRTDLDAPLPH